MRICRAEIARSQAVTPRRNFVVLLGDRHGWRPLPDEIPAAEFEALLPHLPAELANRWYKLDEDIVCPRPCPGFDLSKGTVEYTPVKSPWNIRLRFARFLGCCLFLGFALTSHAAPHIVITHLPPHGSTDDLAGVVTGTNGSGCAVAVFIKETEGTLMT